MSVNAERGIGEALLTHWHGFCRMERDFRYGRTLIVGNSSSFPKGKARLMVLGEGHRARRRGRSQTFVGPEDSSNGERGKRKDNSHDE